MSERTCDIAGCDRKHEARGFCRKHYAQWRTSNGERICSVDECGRPAHARGWCTTHYQRWKNNGSPTALQPRYPDSPCTVDECDLPGRSKGMCQMHYARWKRHGDPAVLTVHQRPQNLSVPEILDWYIQRGESDECWPWTGQSIRGYGYFEVGGRDNRRVLKATRVVVELRDGIELAVDEVVMHTCDNPPCCNPAHLVVGTQADNIADMMAKGRSYWQKRHRSVS